MSNLFLKIAPTLLGSIFAGICLLSVHGHLFAQQSTISDEKFEVISPKNNETVSGEYEVRARIADQPLGSYRVFWYADPNDPHELKDNPEENVKYQTIDFSGWKWNKSGKYPITFKFTDTNKNTLKLKRIMVQAQ